MILWTREIDAEVLLLFYIYHTFIIHLLDKHQCPFSKKLKCYIPSTHTYLKEIRLFNRLRPVQKILVIQFNSHNVFATVFWTIFDVHTIIIIIILYRIVFTFYHNHYYIFRYWFCVFVEIKFILFIFFFYHFFFHVYYSVSSINHRRTFSSM